MLIIETVTFPLGIEHFLFVGCPSCKGKHLYLSNICGGGSLDVSLMHSLNQLCSDVDFGVFTYDRRLETQW